MPSPFRIPIVGNSFRDPEEQEFFSDLQSNPSLGILHFEAEPTNPHDPEAIKVLCTTVGSPRVEVHLGYIPRHSTHLIHSAWKRHYIVEKDLIPNSNMMNVTFREAEEPELELHMPEYNPDPDAGDR